MPQTTKINSNLKLFSKCSVMFDSIKRDVMIWNGVKTTIIQWFWKGFSKMHVGLSLWKYWPPDLEQKQVIFIMFILWIFPIPNPGGCQIVYSASIITYVLPDCGSSYKICNCGSDQETMTWQWISFHRRRNETAHVLKTQMPLSQWSISLLKVFGPNSFRQVICPVNILQKPESTRQMQNEPCQPVHMVAWVNHLYLHSPSIKCLGRGAVFISLACI